MEGGDGSAAARLERAEAEIRQLLDEQEEQRVRFAEAMDLAEQDWGQQQEELTNAALAGDTAGASCARRRELCLEIDDLTRQLQAPQAAAPAPPPGPPLEGTAEELDARLQLCERDRAALRESWERERVKLHAALAAREEGWRAERERLQEGAKSPAPAPAPAPAAHPQLLCGASTQQRAELAREVAALSARLAAQAALLRSDRPAAPLLPHCVYESESEVRLVVELPAVGPQDLQVAVDDALGEASGVRVHIAAAKRPRGVSFREAAFTLREGGTATWGPAELTVDIPGHFACPEQPGSGLEEGVLQLWWQKRQPKRNVLRVAAPGAPESEDPSAAGRYSP